MRIAYFITRSDAIGGAHVHVRDLSHAMLRAGHDVRVLVGGEGPFTEQLDERGVPVVHLKHTVRAIRPSSDVRAFGEVASVLREFRPDLLSTHSAKAGWIGRIVGRALRIPTLFTVHGWSFTDGRPPMQRRLYLGLEKVTGRLATKVITVSNYDRALAMDHRIAGAARLVTVHNGMPDITDELRASHRADPITRLITVARFEEPKDHPTLIRALADLKHVPWELEIIGDGPLMARSKDLANELGVASRIQFQGLRTDVAERLARSHAFVLVTKWEGFPRSILEAMRAGLPVVASAVGGVPESVKDGETGFLIPRGDQATLTDRLAKLIGDPALRLEMGSRGRQYFVEEFTFDHMLDKTLEVYRAALG